MYELKIRWDQQAFCEAELTTWLQSKEAEVGLAISAVTPSSCTATVAAYSTLVNSLEKAGLQALREQIIGRRPVLLKLAQRRCQLEAATATTSKSSCHLFTSPGSPIAILSQQTVDLLARLDEALSTRQVLLNDALAAARLGNETGLDAGLKLVVQRAVDLEESLRNVQQPIQGDIEEYCLAVIVSMGRLLSINLEKGDSPTMEAYFS
ncbi:unnamed protein product [Protopolystoma xenopodis]|uniref:Uncharacterized protein n=1 Tax=Protopolystoma xenopodis TaxID=117903 RepID=A0A448WY39_9PLAT|nr:unnamed protein product [Protopolystoma xenopodis]